MDILLGACALSATILLAAIAINAGRIARDLKRIANQGEPIVQDQQSINDSIRQQERIKAEVWAALNRKPPEGGTLVNS